MLYLQPTHPSTSLTPNLYPTHLITIRFPYSLLHPTLHYPPAFPTTFLLPPFFSQWYPWLCPTTFSYFSWPASLLKAMQVLPCWPAAPPACRARQTIPCGREGVGLGAVGTLRLRAQQITAFLCGARWGHLRPAT